MVRIVCGENSCFSFDETTGMLNKQDALKPVATDNDGSILYMVGGGDGKGQIYKGYAIDGWSSVRYDGMTSGSPMFRQTSDARFDEHVTVGRYDNGRKPDSERNENIAAVMSFNMSGDYAADVDERVVSAMSFGLSHSDYSITSDGADRVGAMYFGGSHADRAGRPIKSDAEMSSIPVSTLEPMGVISVSDMSMLEPLTPEPIKVLTLSDRSSLDITDVLMEGCHMAGINMDVESSETGTVYSASEGFAEESPFESGANHMIMFKECNKSPVMFSVPTTAFMVPPALTAVTPVAVY